MPWSSSWRVIGPYAGFTDRKVLKRIIVVNSSIGFCKELILKMSIWASHSSVTIEFMDVFGFGVYP
jgi:hypothetical protein